MHKETQKLNAMATNENTRIIDLTVSQLEEIIGVTVKKSFQDQTQPPREDPEEIGGIELAQNITGLSKQTIYGLTAKKKIPHMKPGGKILRFSRTDLLKWIKTYRKKTTSEIEQEAKAYILRKPLRRSK